MSDLRGLLVVSLAVGLAAGPTSIPPMLGFESSPLVEADAAQVLGVLKSEGLQVWFLRAAPFISAGTQEPPQWVIEAYVAPQVTTARVRRGRLVVFGRESQSRDAPSVWRRTSGEQQYAEVSRPGATLPTMMSVPLETEVPFEVDRAISDDDLVAIIDLVRAPIPAATLFRLNRTACPDPASERVITQVRREDEENIEVYVSACSFIVKKQQGTWVIAGIYVPAG